MLLASRPGSKPAWEHDACVGVGGGPLLVIVAAGVGSAVDVSFAVHPVDV